MHLQIDFNEDVKLVVHCGFKAGKPAKVNGLPENCNDGEEPELVFEKDDIYMLVNEAAGEAAIVSSSVVVMFYDELLEQAIKKDKEEAEFNKEELYER